MDGKTGVYRVRRGGNGACDFDSFRVLNLLREDAARAWNAP
jgi:hypothetical protein